MASRQKGPGSTYGDKLKDPRWQKRRLAILERDEWACQLCRRGDQTLHVHHRYYEPGKDPWEAGDDALVTLCAECHEIETHDRRMAEDRLLAVLRRHLLAVEVVWLADGLEQMPRDILYSLAAGGVEPYGWWKLEDWLHPIVAAAEAERQQNKGAVAE